MNINFVSFMAGKTLIGINAPFMLQPTTIVNHYQDDKRQGVNFIPTAFRMIVPVRKLQPKPQLKAVK